MSNDAEAQKDALQLIASQRAYYDLRAPDYGDVTKPPDRTTPGLLGSTAVARLIDEFAPSGDVLELACGPGGCTRELLRHARTVTAVDGSPRMLELNQASVGDPAVIYVCADLFEWTPPRQFDVVFFGFWLSHVPPTHFDAFWSLVRSCLGPDGRVGFVDEDGRAAVHEALHSDAEVPTARRTLADARSFEIIKVFWTAEDLERRLGEIGWHGVVRPVGESFLYGTARFAN